MGEVIHLAARAGVRQSVENPWIYFETNVGYDHRFGQLALACSRWIAKSSGYGLDLAIQAEQGGRNDDHSLSLDHSTLRVSKLRGERAYV